MEETTQQNYNQQVPYKSEKLVAGILGILIGYLEFTSFT